MGRHGEAIERLQQAQTLDPLSPVISGTLGYIYYNARQYEKAIEQCLNTIEMFPDFYLTYHYLATAYVKKGLYEEAINRQQMAVRLSGGSIYMKAHLGRIYGVSRRHTEAQEILKELREHSKQSYTPMMYFALVHTGLDDLDQMFAWLDQAYMTRSPLLPFIKVDPQFDRFRSDSRFVALLQKMELDE
jgi:tetratricopeptide (TPR) repeat protein